MADVVELDMNQVDMEKMLSTEDAKAGVAKVQEAMEANPAFNKVMEAVKTVEDMYEVAKAYVKMKYEDFKVLANKTMEYYRNSKVELKDETMDYVVGGWSFSGFWNKYKKVIIATAIVAAAAIVTGGIGAAVGPALVVGIVDATAAVVSGAACTGIGIAVGGSIGVLAGGAVAMTYEQEHGMI